ncbi:MULTISPECIES: hypothetical protein [unclassified Streptomyces]|uniref:hypothetical protein n=1 Tax=unclassified Streptomyces TaxID=2593676 RepID=UPI002256A892|nr:MULTISPECIES: hypothetical protein [unclassified Streptomyces]MCX4885544.1 hypothetical protein [Streptomyces sp. NBC_00847]MCX5425408.1 hypothetical protein [Streptomyces sp. NBC_00078]
MTTRILVTGGAGFIGSHSVLGHERRHLAGIDPVRPWRAVREAAFPVPLDEKKGSTR